MLFLIYSKKIKRRNQKELLNSRRIFGAWCTKCTVTVRKYARIFLSKLVSTSRRSACLYGGYGDFTFTSVTSLFLHWGSDSFVSRDLDFRDEVKKENHINPVLPSVLL
jgi:hypothetical protein